MINNSSSKSDWCLITIDDPRFLEGRSVFDFIKLLTGVIHFKFVVFNDFEASTIRGRRNWETVLALQNQVIQINDFLEILPDINQFDWCDLYLFKEYPQNWKNDKEIPDYPNLIIQTDTTVRLVDDQYFYIYSNKQEVIDYIKENFIIEIIKYGALIDLDYPR